MNHFRVWVKTFEPRFEASIRAGEKVGTMRPTPKRMPTVGDQIDCRMWTGLPYRSPQAKISTFMITGVYPVVISDEGMTVVLPHKRMEKRLDQAKPKHRLALDQIAKGDGFESWKEMLGWFSDRYDLPFRGLWIYWGRVV